MHEADELDEFLRGLAAENPGPPRPGWFYSKDVDCLHVYLEPVEHYAEWICPGLSVYRAFDDKRIVGMHVEGVLARLEGIADAR